jgi:hypothetical protein
MREVLDQGGVVSVDSGRSDGVESQPLREGQGMGAAIIVAAAVLGFLMMFVLAATTVAAVLP